MRISLALLTLGLVATTSYAHEAAVPKAPYMQQYFLGSDLLVQKFLSAGIEPSLEPNQWSLTENAVHGQKSTRSVRLLTPATDRWRFKEETSTVLGYGWQAAAGFGRMGRLKAIISIGLSRPF